MKASRYPWLFLFALTCGLLWQCDTALNVKSPASNYFIKYYGNEGSQTGIDFAIDPADQSFIMLGTTQIGDGDPRFFLVKTDPEGNIKWERTFGSAKCQARDVEVANDGKIVVLGNMVAAYRGGTDYDVYIKRFDTQGNPLDSNTVTGFIDNTTGQPADENASTITQTSDGFMVAGYTGNLNTKTSGFVNYPLLLRFDNNLHKYTTVPWPDTVTLNNGHISASTKILQMPDSSFYVFGYTSYKSNASQDGDLDFYYFSMTANGQVTGNIDYVSSPGKDQKLFSVFSDTTRLGDGFFLGGLETDGNGSKLFYTKLTRPPLSFTPGDYIITPNSLPVSLGQLNSILNPPFALNQFVSVAKASNGFLLLTNEATGSNSNIFLVKIDYFGNTTGANAWGPFIFGGEGDDFAGAVQELRDGKIAILGTMTVGQAAVNNGETKMTLIKVNQKGQFAD